jgi:hypothetical protein
MESRDANVVRKTCLHPNRFFMYGDADVKACLPPQFLDELNKNEVIILYSGDNNISNTKIKKLIHKFKNWAKLNLYDLEF